LVGLAAVAETAPRGGQAAWVRFRVVRWCRAVLGAAPAWPRLGDGRVVFGLLW